MASVLHQRGGLHSFEARQRGLVEAGQHAWCTTVHALGFVSHAILEMDSSVGHRLALSDPGKPWQDGADESASTASSETNACGLNGSGRAAKRPLSSRLGGVTRGRTAA